MSDLISLDINSKGIEQIAKSMAADEKSLNIALNRAIRKTSKWVITHLSRGLASETGIPQSIIKKRLKHFLTPNDLTAKIWLGLLPVSASHLKPKQTKAGVKAGKHFFKNAFIVNKTRPLVFKRTTKTALPIEKQSINMESQADNIIESILPSVQKRLQQTLTQELRWILNQQR